MTEKDVLAARAHCMTVFPSGVHFGNDSEFMHRERGFLAGCAYKAQEKSEAVVRSFEEYFDKWWEDQDGFVNKGACRKIGSRFWTAAHAVGKAEGEAKIASHEDQMAGLEPERCRHIQEIKTKDARIKVLERQVACSYSHEPMNILRDFYCAKCGFSRLATHNASNIPCKEGGT